MRAHYWWHFIYGKKRRYEFEPGLPGTRWVVRCKLCGHVYSTTKLDSSAPHS